MCLYVYVYHCSCPRVSWSRWKATISKSMRPNDTIAMQCKKRTKRESGSQEKNEMPESYKNRTPRSKKPTANKEELWSTCKKKESALACA
jgi:hypothetical protein